jgi:membrane protease YdiL (CAAX protease family)
MDRHEVLHFRDDALTLAASGNPFMSDPTSLSPVPSAFTPETPPPPPKPVSKVRWSIHLALMAALPIVAGFGGLSRRHSGAAFSDNVTGLLTACAFELLFFAIPFALAWGVSRASKDDLLLRWRPGWLVLPLGAFYSVAVRFAAGIVVGIGAAIVAISKGTTAADMQKFTLEHRPQVEKLVDIHAMSHSPLYFWLNVVLVSLVVGGLREELWRSSFLAGLRALWPKWFASTNGGIASAGVAALFFGAAHLPQGILAAVLITVVGFLLGVIMVMHRSIWPSVVAHGLFDAASMAALPWVMQYLHKLQQMQGMPHVGS